MTARTVLPRCGIILAATAWETPLGAAGAPPGNLHADGPLVSSMMKSNPMQTMSRSFTLALAVLALSSLSACQHQGPAEQAGKSMDSTGQKIQDAINPPGPLQKAGRTIDKAMQ